VDNNEYLDFLAEQAAKAELHENPLQNLADMAGRLAKRAGQAAKHGVAGDFGPGVRARSELDIMDIESQMWKTFVRYMTMQPDKESRKFPVSTESVLNFLHQVYDVDITREVLADDAMRRAAVMQDFAAQGGQWTKNEKLAELIEKVVERDGLTHTQQQDYFGSKSDRQLEATFHLYAYMADKRGHDDLMGHPLQRKGALRDIFRQLAAKVLNHERLEVSDVDQMAVRLPEEQPREAKASLERLRDAMEAIGGVAYVKPITQILRDFDIASSMIDSTYENALAKFEDEIRTGRMQASEEDVFVAYIRDLRRREKYLQGYDAETARTILDQMEMSEDMQPYLDSHEAAIAESYSPYVDILVEGTVMDLDPSDKLSKADVRKIFDVAARKHAPSLMAQTGDRAALATKDAIDRKDAGSAQTKSGQNASGPTTLSHFDGDVIDVGVLEEELNKFLQPADVEQLLRRPDASEMARILDRLGASDARAASKVFNAFMKALKK
jgi:hypothetical protein